MCNYKLGIAEYEVPERVKKLMNAALFVNPVLSSSEPAPTITTLPADDVTADPVSILSFCLRQGNSSNAPILQFDGLRIATTWGESPMPVALSSFNSVVANRSVKLNWITESEINNIGFEVQRKSSEPGTVNGEQWKNIVAWCRQEYLCP